MQVSLQKLAVAFDAWERGYRAEPTKFLTPEECAAIAVDQLSADRAAYMLDLLAQQTCQHTKSSDDGTELLTWHRLPGQMPTHGNAVLICFRNGSVMPAYFDPSDDVWRTSAGVVFGVLGWADMPAGLVGLPC